MGLICKGSNYSKEGCYDQCCRNSLFCGRCQSKFQLWMNSELGGNEEIHDTFLVYELLTWKPWKIFVTLLNLCSNLGKKIARTHWKVIDRGSCARSDSLVQKVCGLELSLMTLLVDKWPKMLVIFSYHNHVCLFVFVFFRSIPGQSMKTNCCRKSSKIKTSQQKIQMRWDAACSFYFYVGFLFCYVVIIFLSVCQKALFGAPN